MAANLQRLAVLGVITCAWSTDAVAANCPVTFCVEYETAFIDKEGADFWTTNVPRTADGIKVTADGIGSGAPTFQDFASDPGGCVTFTLDDAYEYAVYAQSEAEVNGNLLRVWDDHATPSEYVWIAYDWSGNSYDPTQCNVNEAIEIPFDTNSAMLAVGTRMIGMNNFGLASSASSGTPFDYYDETCCDGGISINASSTSQTIIAHETGHAIGRRRDEGDAQFDYGASELNCDGDNVPQDKHAQVSREYQSAAASEGFADILSAWTWNDTSEDNCLYNRHYASDFDLDGVQDNNEALKVGQTKCGAVPAAGLASYVSGKDWLDDLVQANDPAVCNGSPTGCSTQLDWLRYGWDMLHNESVPIGEIVDIYDAANPYTWDPDLPASGSGSSGTADDPIVRWESAADGQGYGTEHDNQKDNGQDH